LRRRLAGLGLASVAVLLPTAALALPAGSSCAASARAAAVTAVPICRAVNTRVWYGLPAGLARLSGQLPEPTLDTAIR
jgi:hypothetical protein